MTPEQIKDQMLRIEGFADGIKNGAAILAKWLIEQLQAEQKKGDGNTGDSNGSPIV